MTATLTIDGLRLLHRYDTARKAIQMWSEEKDLVRDELIAAMGDQNEGYWEDKRVLTVSRGRPKRFDSSSFAVDHPELYRRYLVEAATEEVRVVVPTKLPPVPGPYSRFYDEVKP